MKNITANDVEMPDFSSLPKDYDHVRDGLPFGKAKAILQAAILAFLHNVNVVVTQSVEAVEAGVEHGFMPVPEPQLEHYNLDDWFVHGMVRVEDSRAIIGKLEHNPDEMKEALSRENHLLA